MAYPQQPTPPPYPPSTPRRILGMPVALFAGLATVAAVVVLCCVVGVVAVALNPPEEEPAADTPTASPASPTPPEGTASPTPASRPSPSPSPEPSPTPEQIAIPEGLIGANAAVAEDQLRAAGFTNIDFGSVDPDATVVLLPANWTVVGVEPEPGTRVRADALIVLSCSKA